MTLIEVLIAMVVSTFVLISIGYTFVSQRALERHRGALASIQDGARVGLDMLALDLRQAGYVGCNSNLQRNTVEKTVRQQASSIYQKAGVSGRHAFAAWFLVHQLGLVG